MVDLEIKNSMENSGWMLALKVKKSGSASWALPDVGKA